MTTKDSLQSTQDPTKWISLHHQHEFFKICFSIPS